LVILLYPSISREAARLTSSLIFLFFNSVGFIDRFFLPVVGVMGAIEGMHHDGYGGKGE
jgi:hypothetical protein